ncbi:hypothetical protein [Thalassolituus sp. UBA2009]|jgi:hypothetical protein|uniref:hypothetical protein n=1 Tax=Thalassolituus sp. UBA2009 TaxID=1947658 RepID=UPI00257B930F|nr:hypothetical protein [Thalassolituus sp. UBA2009]
MSLSALCQRGATAPRLSLEQDAALLRRELATSFRTLTSVEVAWQHGQRAATPGTAFFCGYQAAMRQLDPQLAADAWAAFCISEAGLRSLRQMQTRFDERTSCLNGEKSHVMLARRGLDLLYVVAVCDDDLVCVQVTADAAGVEPLEARKEQPFLPDVPHTPVHFSNVTVTSAYRCLHAHQQLNKPFRYWEDVHVALAFSGWLMANADADNTHSLVAAAGRLADIFSARPKDYSLAALDALEDVLACQDELLPLLADDVRALWLRDRILLQLAVPLRGKIRASLMAAQASV